jgi:hypothetical protein
MSTYIIAQSIKSKSPLNFRSGDSSLNNKRWQFPTLPDLTPVPSAARGLTALFDMEKGVHPPYRHQPLVDLYTKSLDLFKPTTKAGLHPTENTQSLTQSTTKQKNTDTTPGSLVRLSSTCLQATTCRLSTSSSPTAFSQNIHLGASFALRCFQRLS